MDVLESRDDEIDAVFRWYSCANVLEVLLVKQGTGAGARGDGFRRGEMFT